MATTFRNIRLIFNVTLGLRYHILEPKMTIDMIPEEDWPRFHGNLYEIYTLTQAQHHKPDGTPVWENLDRKLLESGQVTWNTETAQFDYHTIDSAKEYTNMGRPKINIRPQDLPVGVTVDNSVRINELKEQLAQTTDQGMKKQIRLKLRKLGYSVSEEKKKATE